MQVAVFVQVTHCVDLNIVNGSLPSIRLVGSPTGFSTFILKMPTGNALLFLVAT